MKVQQGKEGLALPESEMFRKGIGGSLGAFVMGTEEQQQRLPRATKNLQARTNGRSIPTSSSGKAPGRTRPEQITHYRTIGNWGVQFSSVGGLVYRKAKAAGLGTNCRPNGFCRISATDHHATRRHEHPQILARQADDV